MNKYKITYGVVRFEGDLTEVNADYFEFVFPIYHRFYDIYKTKRKFWLWEWEKIHYNLVAEVKFAQSVSKIN